MRPVGPTTWPILAIGSLIGMVGVALWLLYQRPSHEREAILTFLGFGITIALPLVLAMVRWLWHRRTAHGNGGSSSDEELADRLAEVVQAEWLRAAAERQLLAPWPIPLRLQPTGLPVAGPLSAAFRRAEGVFAFVDPVPGVVPLDQESMRSISLAELHAVYSTLASGRLIILGEAGSGKTTTAMLLLLEALKHRESLPVTDRHRVPVPVIIELAGWNPVEQTLDTWVLRQLRSTYGLTAPEHKEGLRRLVISGRLAPLLDGLDELPSVLRPAALWAIDEQATYRVVLLSRPEELVAAAEQAHLSGAVALELEHVRPGVVEEYIVFSQVNPLPAAWRALLDGIRAEPTSILSRSLSTPLLLSLLRDTYSSLDRPDELLDADKFDTTERIEKHLLGRVVPAAFVRHPGAKTPRYSLETAQRTLGYLAWHMAEEGTRDFAWWRIPDWVPTRRRSAFIGGFFGLALGAAIGLATGVAFGAQVGSKLGLLTGVVGGVLAAMAAARTGPPRHLGRSTVRALIAKDALRREALIAVTTGLVSGLVFGVIGGPKWGMVVGPATALAFGLAGVVAGAFGHPAGVESLHPALDPVRSWKDDQRYGVVAGLIAGSVAGATFGLLFGLYDLVTVGPGAAAESALGFGLPSAVLVGLIYAALAPRAATTLGACLQLRYQRGTPIRIVRFLEEARALQILRVVGPIYQFRHIRLQDHLASSYGKASSNAPKGLRGPQRRTKIIR
jgi:hypothetical protein